MSHYRCHVLKSLLIVALLTMVYAAPSIDQLIMLWDTVKGSALPDWVDGVVGINDAVVIVYGSTGNALLIASINITSGSTIWARALGLDGSLGEHPEFRDAVIDGDYVYLTGYVNIGGGRQLCAARFNIYTGALDWDRNFRL